MYRGVVSLLKRKKSALLIVRPWKKQNHEHLDAFPFKNLFSVTHSHLLCSSGFFAVWYSILIKLKTKFS